VTEWGVDDPEAIAGWVSGETIERLAEEIELAARRQLAPGRPRPPGKPPAGHDES
jgi:hypothetical protein